MNFQTLRRRMVHTQLISRGIKDDDVLSAMSLTARENFVSEDLVRHSYNDTPLPIDCGQSISQPFIIAYMLEKLELDSAAKVLEIGTGSGYNAAVLSEIVNEVHTVEIIKTLAKEARQKYETMGYHNIHVKHGDGYLGWEEEAPFDAIILTAAPSEIPQILFDQLSEGGRMIAPVGDQAQSLIIYKKENGGIVEQDLIAVRFVPMVDESFLIKNDIIKKPQL